ALFADLGDRSIHGARLPHLRHVHTVSGRGRDQTHPVRYGVGLAAADVRVESDRDPAARSPACSTRGEDMRLMVDAPSTRLATPTFPTRPAALADEAGRPDTS